MSDANKMSHRRSRYAEYFGFKPSSHHTRPGSPKSGTSSPRRSVSPASPIDSVTMASSPKGSFEDGRDAPAITTRRIDFSKETLPEYDDMFAIVIDNVLSHAECKELLHEAESSAGDNGWERAMVNVGNGQQAFQSDTRNCGRIIWDSQATIDKIWERISDLPELQEILRLQNIPHVTGNGPARREEVWKFTRPNDRMRFLKYATGEYFRPHCDGSYETPDRKERSYYTMHLYLNDAGPLSSTQLKSLPKDERKSAAKSCLLGGNTAFHSYDGNRYFDVKPKAGSILIFQHRDLLHSGTDVLQGTKHTMRTDLMYTRESTKANDRSRMPIH